MLYARISGLASYVPDDILDNEQLSQMVDTSDEWITTRVGIKERRVLKKPVGSSYMGIIAVNRLLEQTGTNPADVDLLICATSNPDYRFPSTASIIAHNCGIEQKLTPMTSREPVPDFWLLCRVLPPMCAVACTRR